MQIDADDVRALAREKDGHGAAVADTLADGARAQQQNFLVCEPSSHVASLPAGAV